MAEILVQMKHVLKIANTGQAFSESLRTHVRNLSVEKHPILQDPIYVPNLTTKQCKEAMDVVLEDI